MRLEGEDELSIIKGFYFYPRSKPQKDWGGEKSDNQMQVSKQTTMPSRWIMDQQGAKIEVGRRMEAIVKISGKMMVTTKAVVVEMERSKQIQEIVKQIQE